jgi:hypothetical protein
MSSTSRPLLDTCFRDESGLLTHELAYPQRAELETVAAVSAASAVAAAAIIEAHW